MTRINALNPPHHPCYPRYARFRFFSISPRRPRVIRAVGNRTDAIAIIFGIVLSETLAAPITLCGLGSILCIRSDRGYTSFDKLTSMDRNTIEMIVRALNDHQVQYLIVGGLAVVAHGYVRFTADVDLVLAVDQENLTRAVHVMQSLDYRPRAPVAIEQFIDPAMRAKWAVEKNMVVFSLFSPLHPATEIDLFLDPPIDFAKAHSAAIRVEVAAGVHATFCSLDDLIQMKQLAARKRDAEDIAQLRKLHKRTADE